MADINITITIPDAWITRVQDALTGQVNENISIEFGNSHIRYTYEEKGTDTWIQFAERVFKEHLKNQIKVYELSIDSIRYTDEIRAITQPIEDVPDDILT